MTRPARWIESASRTLVCGAAVLAIASIAAAACSTDPGVGASPTGGTGAGSGTGGSAGAGNRSGTGGTGGIVGLPDGGPNSAGGAGGMIIGKDPDKMNCGVVRPSLEKQPVELLLVLDRSGSMKNGVNPATGQPCSLGPTCPMRWEMAVGALTPVIQKTEKEVHWGLKLFPDKGAPDRYCGVLDTVAVPMAAANASAVIAGIPNPMGDPKSPEVDGNTPTRDGITKGLTYLKARTTPYEKYMLLATDGAPNCTASNRDTTDGPPAVQAIADALKAGIPTFVVGMATQAGLGYTDILNMMAVAGGKARNDPRTRYFSADTKDELTTALASIIMQVTSCIFALDRPPPVPENVLVKFDGTRIPQDTTHMNGWDYGPGMTTIQFYGPACQKIQGNQVRVLDVLFGCKDVPIE